MNSLPAISMAKAPDRAPHVLAGRSEGVGDVIEDRFHRSSLETPNL
ncbi:hypothetical protein X773_31015 [Mesorhizobium sp. LSJC285A00]|nr:hypothetical protein X773_31015 [Mesorhizobium sp. LSJC285A00]